MRRTLTAVAGLCALAGTLFLAGGASPAGAQEGCGGYFNPCAPDVLEFEYPACIVAGDPFSVEGSVTPAEAESAGDEVDFDISGTEVGDVDIEDDGTFSATFTAPNLALGEYTITGATGELEASGSIDVCADSGVGGTGDDNNGGAGGAGGGNNTAGNTPLARTGFDATPMVTLGAAVLILGAAAVYGSKRRQVA